MQIKEIRHHALQAYIDSEEYKTASYIAISKHRAHAHICNPRAQSDDLVLVLIYEAEEMVAYLGVFADDLHFSTGIEHVGWLSCMSITLLLSLCVCLCVCVFVVSVCVVRARGVERIEITALVATTPEFRAKEPLGGRHPWASLLESIDLSACRLNCLSERPSRV